MINRLLDPKTMDQIRAHIHRQHRQQRRLTRENREALRRTHPAIPPAHMPNDYYRQADPTAGETDD